MPQYNADLHLHSPYSIAVSKNMILPRLKHSATMKGIHILGTGDITQPSWRSYLRNNLIKEGDCFFYQDLAFILQTELEDIESIHHVVLLPDFRAAESLTERLRPYVKNIDGRWAGRPHVHRSPSELVEIVEEVNGLMGPAHAFTPFKSLFRGGKFNSLEDAFDTAVKKLGFLELGLSADSYLADRIENLSAISFLSNSDAHSEALDSIGREFNRLEIQVPSFSEVRKACLRRGNRKVTLNAGLDPRLGKYYHMYCSKCRRRVHRHYPEASLPNIKDHQRQSGSSQWNPSAKVRVDAQFLTYNFRSATEEQDFLKQVSLGKIECRACQQEIENPSSQVIKTAQPNKEYKSAPSPRKRRKKIPRLQLGVSERINELATWTTPHPPSHRPPYQHLIPLIELLSSLYGIKTLTSKTLTTHYHQLVNQYGTEYHILMDLPLSELDTSRYAPMIPILRAFRENRIPIIPGGGGNFGMIGNVHDL